MAADTADPIVPYRERSLLDLADAALGIQGLDGTDAVEVVLNRTASALTRFAESRIHQNVVRGDGEARVRVVVDGNRVGVVATNELTAAAIRLAAERAREAATVTPPDPGFGGLAEPPPDGYPQVSAYDAETAAAPPALRADLVARMLAELPRGMYGAGAVTTESGELAVVNSLGVRVTSRSTRAALRILASGADSTGYAESSAMRVGDLTAETLGERAADKVARSARPHELPPGRYPVVFEPAATGTLVRWLAHSAFAGKAVFEGRSPLTGRIGEAVCSPLVTVVDDATSPLLPGTPFDYEGTPKRPTPLLVRGSAVGVTHDRASARLAGAPGSTGHALPAPSADGGIALHLLMEPGEASLDELVAGLDGGLLVTRLHYTNLVHPTTATITGMTRDGTFWVEGGRVVHGVRNLRFTQSILDALGDVAAVGRESEMSSQLLYGGVRAPAVRLGSFAFTSATAY